jgi:outer membrane cobalamin receptor
MKTLYTLGLITCLLMSGLTVYSQETKKYDSMTREEIMQMSLEDLLALPFEDLLNLANKLGVSIDDLLKMKTTVASKTALTPRETPGIISIITDEEIKAMGARDLTDVLTLIPGIKITYDAQGVVGIQIRGNWGFEGKVLFLIDGLEFNELQYNVFPLFNHIQVDNIKRIEIIRGPGSAIYGGSAELGVVNIITKNGSEINGVQVDASTGITSTINSKNTTGLYVGEKIGEFQYAINIANSTSHMSDGKLIDTSGVFNMADSLLPMENSNINLAFSYKGLKANFLYDYYKTDYGDYANYDTLYTSEFKTIIGNISYDYAFGKKFHLIPSISFKHSKPYYDNTYRYCININRYRRGLQASFDISEKVNLLAGIDYYNDDYNMNNSGTKSYFGTKESNTNLALYAQTLIKTNFVNFTLGARYENNSEFGRAIAPRFAVTKAFDRFHLKLLASGSFRSPAIGNMVHTSCDSSWSLESYSFERNNVKPEKTWVYEFEAGYKLNHNMFITANIFDITINNTITWFENDYDWGYLNKTKTGTRGFEIEYKAKYERVSGNISYSCYTAKNKNTVDYYAVDGNENIFLGSPQNKIALSAGYRILESLSLSTSVNYYSKQYEYDSDNQIIVEYNGSTTLNGFLMYQSNYVNAGIGVNNILNQKSYWLQPYKGYAMPMPLLSREIFIKVTFNLPF